MSSDHHSLMMVAAAHDASIYQTLFENMDDGFCVIRFLDGPHGPLSDYLHVLANPAYERHTGIANVVGQYLREMVPDEADDWIAFYGKVLRTGEPLRFRNELVATSRHLEVSSFRIGSFEDRLVAVLFKDVTDRVRAEGALQQLNETLELRVARALEEREVAELALRQAQKMEAVGQLTGGIAHDFNNLLAGITGAFELIARRIDKGRADEVPRYVDAGLAAAQRAAALTHRLLAFSRRQTLAPKPTDMNTLVADFIDLVRRTMGPDIAVEIREEAELWPAMVDANQLENAVLNLCINARDAMPDGGRLVISTQNVLLDEDGALARGLTAGDYATISVADDGAGIADHDIERVFEPFFTTKPTGRGTGLGLSMVYGFARQSNGLVRIRSRLGEGTLVRLYLPRYQGCVEVANQTSPHHQMTPLPEATVLVVDDEPTVRMMMVDALELVGIRCLEARDGASALAHLDRCPDVDLLVTDVGLPGGMNGRQVADEARRRRPDLAVLFVTGYADRINLLENPETTTIDVLTKPFGIEDLQERVAKLLGAAKVSPAP